MISAIIGILIGAGTGLSEPVGTGDGWPDFTDPAAHWGWPESGYLIESKRDQELHDAGIRAFRADWERNRSRFSTPIISIIGGRLFAMPQSHRGLFAAREHRCETCYTFQPLESGSAETLPRTVELSLRAAGIDPQAYDTILVLTDFDDGHSWDDIRPLKPLSESVREGYFRKSNWYAAGLEGEGLYAVPVRKVAIVYPPYEPTIRAKAAPWYLERLGPSSPEWVNASLRGLKGSDPREFYTEHRYIPMDRSLLDMQYGPLRYSVPVLKYTGEIDDPTEPPEMKYWDEYERARAETRTYNDSLDEILGVTIERPPLAPHRRYGSRAIALYILLFGETDD